MNVLSWKVTSTYVNPRFPLDKLKNNHVFHRDAVRIEYMSSRKYLTQNMYSKNYSSPPVSSLCVLVLTIIKLIEKGDVIKLYPSHLYKSGKD